jgi:hypothetical protein
MNTALATEKILQESDNRFVLFPIKHDQIWAMYKTALAQLLGNGRSRLKSRCN